MNAVRTLEWDQIKRGYYSGSSRLRLISPRKVLLYQPLAQSLGAHPGASVHKKAPQTSYFSPIAAPWREPSSCIWRTKRLHPAGLPPTPPPPPLPAGRSRGLSAEHASDSNQGSHMSHRLTLFRRLTQHTVAYQPCRRLIRQWPPKLRSCASQSINPPPTACDSPGYVSYILAGGTGRHVWCHPTPVLGCISALTYLARRPGLRAKNAGARHCPCQKCVSQNPL